MLESVGKISLLILSIVISIGGVAGFLKAKSKASLAAGLISGGLLAVAYSVSERNAHQGMLLGAIICALLCVVFGIRLKKTKKFMPSGMLLALCALEFVMLLAATLRH